MPIANADVAADGSAYVGDSDPDNGPGGRAWLDVMGKLSLGINNLTAELADAKQREQNRLEHVPNNVAITGFYDNLVSSATFGLVKFGGPQPGREWVLRLLSSVARPLAANASLVTWYVGQPVVTATPGQFEANAVWQFAGGPSFQAFTSDVVHIKPNEVLFAGLTGVPATTALSLVARIDDQLLWDANSR